MTITLTVTPTDLDRNDEFREDLETAFLTQNGWTQTCSTIVGYWTWEKIIIPSGHKFVAMSRVEAINIQRALRSV